MDYCNRKLYDEVIDTTKIDAKAVVEKIIKLAKEK